jgi:hypothetical protein
MCAGHMCWCVSFASEMIDRRLRVSQLHPFCSGLFAREKLCMAREALPVGVAILDAAHHQSVLRI